jgi:hypothetical protein
MRARLLKTLSRDELPVGIEGEVIYSTPDPGTTGTMYVVKWDNEMIIPMFQDEIEILTEDENKS